MELKLKNGSVYRVEPVTILETDEAKEFLAKCAVAPVISNLIVVEDGQKVRREFVAHCTDGPAITQHEDGFGTVAEEYWRYGIRHRVGGERDWAVWEQKLFRQHWHYGALVEDEKHPHLAAELERVAIANAAIAAATKAENGTSNELQ